MHLGTDWLGAQPRRWSERPVNTEKSTHGRRRAKSLASLCPKALYLFAVRAASSVATVLAPLNLVGAGKAAERDSTDRELKGTTTPSTRSVIHRNLDATTGPICRSAGQTPWSGEPPRQWHPSGDAPRNHDVKLNKPTQIPKSGSVRNDPLLRWSWQTANEFPVPHRVQNFGRFSAKFRYFSRFR